MKSIHRFTLMTVSLLALSFVAVGCVSTGSTSGEETFHMVNGDSHRASHPDGHEPKKGRSCYYNTAEDAFFCSF